MKAKSHEDTCTQVNERGRTPQEYCPDETRLGSSPELSPPTSDLTWGCRLEKKKPVEREREKDITRCKDK